MKVLRLLTCMVIFFYFTIESFAGEIVINEFMAANSKTIADESGEFDDWVELYNPGVKSVNIGGMFVTDTLNNLTLWQIPDSDPEKTSIPPGGYLLLWLDKDLNQGILHMNIKLSVDGEAIALVRSDGITIIDSIQFNSQQPDISLGRKTDASNEWVSMQNPTPENANISEVLIETSSPPMLSLDAGFYNANITLVMSALSAQIFYTQIKKNPDSYTQPLITSSQYKQPLVLTESCIIRAWALEDGKLASEILTKTYFIHEDYQMPVISLTIDSKELFDPVEGLYMPGPDVLPDDDWPYWKSNFYQGSYYYKGSKVIETWKDYEKPVHFEYFDSDKNLILDINAGLEMTGVWSRAFPKKSFNIKTRNEYGQTEINYPLFDDNDYSTYDGLTLRAGAEDRSRLKNEIIYMAYREANLRTDMQAYQPAILLINGAYWGIYSLMERKDNDFIKNRYGYEDIDLIADWGLEKDGSIDAFSDLIDFMNDNNVADAVIYKQICEKINIYNFVDHCLMQVYTSHGDPNNIRYWRPRTPEGKWHWIIYDFDWWKSVDDKTLSNYASITEANPEKLLGYMLQNIEFRELFINRLADFINTTGRSENMLRYIDQATTDIEPQIEADINRWMDWATNSGPATYDMGSREWEVNWVKNFVTSRPDYIFQEIIELYSPSGSANITISTGIGKGRIRINTTDINTQTFSGIYFKDIPIQVTAIPDMDYTFAGWSGTNLPRQRIVEFSLTQDMTLIANFIPVSQPIIINEINYNSVETFLSGDWIEIFNRSADSVDISGWHFKDSADAHDYVIPDNIILQSGEYLVIAEDLVAFQSTFPQVSNVIGGFSFGLSGGGEKIQLLNKDLFPIDILTYDDTPPWAMEADGQGFTLELRSPDENNSKAESWGASTIKNGSPGQVNSILNPFVSIQNVIRILQVVSGSSPYFPVQIPDIDKSANIGLSEAIYGLQEISATEITFP
ncbi:Spore coat protein CotH [Candidatus Magnetomorum sp. HK-1]|nr:Spore coat protein CotH [Candidatus Magnetomorum sp. HK-1]